MRVIFLSYRNDETVPGTHSRPGLMLVQRCCAANRPDPCAVFS